MKAMPILLLTASACAPTQSTEPEAIVDLVACGGNKVRSLIGRPYSDSVAEGAARLSGAGAIRWIRPGQPVTMDYRDDRLNFELDEADVILRVRCG